MIPLKDYNPTSRFAVVTAVLIAANILVYFGVQQRQSTQDAFTYERAAIPCELKEHRPLTVLEIEAGRRGISDTACGERAAVPLLNQEAFPNKNVYLAVLDSMFLHGSLLHIGFNMLFLWVFGNNIEDRMGMIPYTAFYLVSGVVATVAHIAAQPDSTVPVIGASGAIAGVMGAYLVVFPRVRIRTAFIFFFIFVRDMAAVWLLLAWFVLQFFTDSQSGVAWVAHVGGFVFGALVALLFRSRLRPTPPPPAPPAWRGGY